ncbi:hypothetical protein MNBD_CHLOROFLEXI01-2349 [hydrothermal vent metagenome]|uniref:Uncharacterized protein n=1 Tax=hydrothermal vent metagenome TaxID=652676 RepID=A0A3B0VA91_9ZZZZ
MVLMESPPKLVYDDSGHLVEVILLAEDYMAYLRNLAAEADWETLPPHLQDAIDRLLIDDVRSEKEDAIDLETLFADSASS